MGIVHEVHACAPPPGQHFASGTVWQCECGRGWYRNSNHSQNVYSLWWPVMPWNFRKRRQLRCR